MNENNSIKITGMIVGGVIVLALIAFFTISSLSPSSEVIRVNGISKVYVVPDRISIYLNVDNVAKTASEAKDNNALIVEEVIKSLEELGLSKDDIATQSFNVYENYEWTGMRSVRNGYKATHVLKVELSAEKSDIVGDVIDAGIDSGALLSYINYELSQELENKYTADALKLATEDARIKAESMADGLGARLGEVVSVSNNDAGYYPWRAYDMALSSESMAKGSEVQTQIIVGEREISASVSVSYKLK